MIAKEQNFYFISFQFILYYRCIHVQEKNNYKLTIQLYVHFE